ncbi:hypothetical protein [Streptomyces sp. NPDC026092]|uniref:hypothetical protein n=1 Tax=Streptomyces sp. NPDC026092 TaxID=3154797 RepID=UPI0033C259DD
MNAPDGPAPTFKVGTIRTTALLMGSLLCGTALAYLLVEATGGHMTEAELRSCLSAAVIASAVFPLLPPHYRVELDDNGLVLHGDGRREIAWRDITSLEIQKTAGIRTVVVHMSGGRQTVLRAPTSFLDSGFDDKVKVLTDWWTAHRGGPTVPSSVRTTHDDQRWPHLSPHQN